MKALVQTLVSLALVGLLFPPCAWGTDDPRGNAGPAMLDYATHQLKDSQDPPHVVVINGTPATLTGHGTSTFAVTATGSTTNTLYSSGGLQWHTTVTQTTTATGTATKTASAAATLTALGIYDPQPGTYTKTGSETATVTTSTTDSETSTQTLTATTTGTATEHGGEGQQCYAAYPPWPNTISATGTLTGTKTATASGTGTGTGTASGTMTASGTSTLVTLQSCVATATHTLTYSWQKTYTTAGTGTITATVSATGSRTWAAAATGTGTGTLAVSDTLTMSGTWTNTNTADSTATSALVADNPKVSNAATLAAGATNVTFTTGTSTATATKVNVGDNPKIYVSAAAADHQHSLDLAFPYGTATGYTDNTITVASTDIGTATPTASKIPIADGSGTLNSWVTGRTYSDHAINAGGTIATDGAGTWTTVASVTIAPTETVSLLASATASLTAGYNDTPCYMRIAHDGSALTIAYIHGRADYTKFTAYAMTIRNTFGATGSHTIDMQIKDDGVAGHTCSVLQNEGILVVSITY